jgi:hypothetical protein
MADPSIQQSQLPARPDWMAGASGLFFERNGGLAKWQVPISLSKGKNYSELVHFCSDMVLSGSNRRVFLPSSR